MKRGPSQSTVFLYQELRPQTLERQKRCSELRSRLWRSHVAVAGNVDLQKTFLLQNAESECRDRLLESRLETLLIAKVESLLSETEAEHSNEAPDLSRPAIQKLNRRPLEKFPIKVVPISQPAHWQRSLAELDASLVQQASLVLDEIDPKYFRLSYYNLQSITTRLPQFQLGKWPRHFFEKKKGQGGDRVRPVFVPDGKLLHDNVFLAFALFEALKDDMPVGCGRDRLQRIWHQLLAAIALCHGCTSEPAFFLSTVDRLLCSMRAEVGRASLGLNP
jgi:hypothetical protein